jgi:hypothetical protein
MVSDTIVSNVHERARCMPISSLIRKGRGAACRKNIFLGSPPEETSPLILINAHRLFGEGSVGGFLKSFSGALPPCLYEE